MDALTVKKNGMKVCTADVGPKGTVTIFVRWSTSGGKSEYTVSVMGLDAAQQRFLNWEVPVVAGGDEIAVRLGQASPPPEPRRWGWDSLRKAVFALLGGA
ncbi:MAG TPA: hypothetical protein VMS98_05715 [Thermoanaerobaculia bacterium]|nr:hypothetical protein [Thermoanaerobaculia bacterium]